MKALFNNLASEVTLHGEKDTYVIPAGGHKELKGADEKHFADHPYVKSEAVTISEMPKAQPKQKTEGQGGQPSAGNQQGGGSQ